MYTAFMENWFIISTLFLIIHYMNCNDKISFSIDINNPFVFVNPDEFSPCIKKDERH